MSQTFHCPNCGGPLDVTNDNASTIRCPYCRSSVIVPEELRSGTSTNRALSAQQAFDELPELVSGIAEIVRLVGEGKKIDAIKKFREHFAASLKDAKEAVEQIERGQVVTISDMQVVHNHTPTLPEDHAELESELNDLLSKQQKIEAIKRLREVYPVSLKDAKEAIDQMERVGRLQEPDSYSGAMGTLDQALQLAQIAQLAQAGERDEAVRRYRVAFDSSLQEAEKVVNQFASNQKGDPSWVVTSVRQNLHRSAPTITPKQVAAIGGGASCGIIGLTAFILLSVIIPVIIGLASSGGPLETLRLRFNPFEPAQLVASFGTEGIGPGSFSDPRSIAAAKDGTFYVAEYSDGRVQHLAADGSSLAFWNIGKDKYTDNIFLTDDNTLNMVYRGKLWRFDTNTGKDLGGLESIDSYYVNSAAATPDGGIVLYTNDETLVRLNTDLQIVWSIPEVVSRATDASIGSCKLAVDGLGNIYLLSSSESAVFKLSPEGRYITRWGSSGDEPGQFRAVDAITVDSQGRVYVSDIYGIKIFESDGRYVDMIDVMGVAFGMTFDAQGRLVIVSNTPKIYIYKIN